MSLELGLQLFSVRDELEKDFVGTLQKVAEIGYKSVEFFIHDASKGMKIGGMEANELKKVLNNLGLNAVSMHVDPLTDEDILEKAIQYNLEIGSTGIGCSIAFFKNKQEVIDFAKALNKCGQKCRENGLAFYYHNHFQEFQKFDGQYVLDILLESTDESLVKSEFDTYWALRGGIDPVDYLKKLGSRCDLVHQKDLPATAKPVNAFEVLGEEKEIGFDEFIGFSKPEYFTEAGEGSMDIKSIIETIRQIGAAKYIFVEQDLTTKNQLESVELSYKNMIQLLDAQ
ncbi:sugar phosphate isomerase/epimerase family protein [Pseudalkalibacillus decolorationis]|uniref:sugar phosphate isomerase/epimerase family protein n=1 Tax=Pseudalkalibacillus decolorationis TaxID=163879 RepID=UPI0021487818|nr:sugar phosphate isomerase/epimerase [Pseudalkalibacillus decolorationis]